MTSMQREFFGGESLKVGKGEVRGWIWLKYIICIYENSKVKPIKIVGDKRAGHGGSHL
jgi:hypothetical protein